VSKPKSKLRKSIVQMKVM